MQKFKRSLVSDDKATSPEGVAGYDPKDGDPVHSILPGGRTKKSGPKAARVAGLGGVLSTCSAVGGGTTDRTLQMLYFRSITVS